MYSLGYLLGGRCSGTFFCTGQFFPPYFLYTIWQTGSLLSFFCVLILFAQFTYQFMYLLCVCVY